MNKILLIIPAYNEEENILKTIEEIRNSDIDVDYIVINDGSTDGTEKILRDNNINHIKLVHNLGIGGAVQTGYKYALFNNYDIAIQYDGDGQHDIYYVPKIIQPLIDEQANMTIGSRFIVKNSKFKSTKTRQVGIRIISFFINLFTGKKIYDTTSGFRACDKKMIENFANSYPTEYPEPVSTVIALKNHNKVVEVPVEMRSRKAGKSSIHTWKNIYYMINVIFSIFVFGVRRNK